MKFILKTLKWIGKLFVGVLVLIILSGALYRLFSSEPVPPGKLIDVNGTKLHIRAEGQKNDLPTLVLEAGAASDSEVFHWIVEGLTKNMRVVRYDREGKWHSEASKDSITSEYYAHQLHKLLEKNGEKPPYILVGHSMGGPYSRIFRDLYPNEVKGLVFLDSSHPEQTERLAQPDSSKNQAFQKTLIILADMGILGLSDQIFGPLFNINIDLPKDSQTRSRNRLLYSAKVWRRTLKEVNIIENILLRAGQTSSLDSLPVLVFTAAEEYNEFRKRQYRNMGVDPDKELQLWFELQKELKELSTKGEQFYIDGNHGSIITKKENAEIINKKILLMVAKI
ncbi:alpha/beta fold hydrolase [Pareuzebyella sediminis]|uniref:alpha/beta fold hydrolase n=1 Tax=Pareuzebyella sediminis TaxID=2607998 RepID=UPI0011EC9561|nr:alpha/beta hydrolase [Pareuzebyella sediminis]